MGVSIPGERSCRELVYVALAAIGRGTESEVGARTGLTHVDVHSHLDALARIDKVTYIEGESWEIVAPRDEREQSWVSDLRDQFERENGAPPAQRELLDEADPANQPGLRTYVGAAACLAAHFQLLEGAQQSVWVLDRPPYLGGLPLPDDQQQPENPEMRAFARGVDVRGIYAPGFRQLARLWYLREFVQTGVPVRIGAAPLKGMIIDERVAFLPARRSYEVDDHMAATVVSNPVLVQVLVELYEESWDNARPVPLALANEDDDRRRELIVRLLAGFTDAAIARALGVTERTVRRWVRDLLTLTGSETRLQLGAALAAYRDTSDDVL